MGHQKRTCHIGELIPLPRGSQLHFPIYKKKMWPGQCHSGFSANCKMWTDFVSYSPCVYKLSVLQIKNFLHIIMSVYYP